MNYHMSHWIKLYQYHLSLLLSYHKNESFRHYNQQLIWIDFCLLSCDLNILYQSTIFLFNFCSVKQKKLSSSFRYQRTFFGSFKVRITWSSFGYQYPFRLVMIMKLAIKWYMSWHSTIKAGFRNVFFKIGVINVIFEIVDLNDLLHFE